MSDYNNQTAGNPIGQPWQQPTQSAGVTDVVTQLQNIVRQLTALTKAINGRVVSGTFTMTATATLVVPEPAVQSLSTITLQAINGTAAFLQASSAVALYISAKTPGASFTVATAQGGNAAGTEQFSYTINTPT